ncbi:WXG100 family type VII secretion target [Nocardia sp. NBC_01327]|uniref:WXG100 family type VII secretion target n=1 Tax=Nocardia sp. NBC_01327 TaxID=2903593 RepID=UPI002E103C74|nr:WXG100 family type VII secretion target [Nocardia sp. NBC_01327]
MADFRVDLDGLQQLIDGAAKLETTIEDAVSTIEKQVDELHVNWDGAAAIAHKGAHDERIAAINEMRQALGALRDKLNTARTAYGAVGPINLGMWP